MRVAVCHNYYQQPGGEDSVFHAEVDLLREHGVDVIPFSVHNDAVEGMGKIKLACKTLWNGDSAREIEALVRREMIDVVHFHNTLPLLSPSAFHGARRGGAAVVKTLHNYRMLCPGSTLFRGEGVCEQCVGKRVPWPGVLHGCYRGDRPATAVVAAMLTAHRAAGTYRNAIDAYITLCEFAREKMIAGGLPAEKLHIKPNFLEPDPGVGDGDGGYAFFLGRLSPEKGVKLLLDAWAEVGCNVPLKVGGSGPMQDDLDRAAAKCSLIEPLGRLSEDDVDMHMKKAALLVLPSVNYEGFPRTVVEAYARGLPVLAPRLGSLEELIRNGETGVHFKPGDPHDLARSAEDLFRNHETRRRMRQPARETYERLYRGETNFQQLLKIYRSALAERGKPDLEPVARDRVQGE